MTNDQLIHRFLDGKTKGGEQSYGLYVEDNKLFSRGRNQWPIATREILKEKAVFIIESYYLNLAASQKHREQVKALALLDPTRIVYEAPHADPAKVADTQKIRFQVVLRSMQSSVKCVLEDIPTVLEALNKIEEFKNLMGLDKRLGVLENPADFQELFSWLLDSNSLINEEDREILRKLWTISMLFQNNNPK
ncbi:MAG: hypothetical protein EHM49_00380 [Deltaproteobacteria bacterium]|nr:MAG: hypothetical protein EHM49_00380 [Deltaproteobacteria bacterium]